MIEGNTGLEFWLGLWIALIGIILFFRWKKSAVGVGLVFAYLIHFWINHWVGSLVYVFPWCSLKGYDVTVLGLQQSVYGLLAFAVGSVAVAPFLIKVFRISKPKASYFVPHPKLPLQYIAIGLLSFFVLGPLIGRIPTVNALVSVGVQLLIVGLCLACWKAWRERRIGALRGWLLLVLGLPFLTLLMQGFLGYGVGWLALVLTFVATFLRPRWKVIIIGLLLGYLGISFYVTYMRDRNEIRDVVWGRGSLVTRIERIYQTIRTVEWFDIHNEKHLARINDRLNQNFLVGSAVDYLTSGYHSYAQGDTLWQAVIAIVPRALWSNKPAVAGSGDIVSDYTGIGFSAGTSVGVGHVMEFYINFGTFCVVIGFLILGTALTILDFGASQRLSQGDWYGFTLWYLPSLGLLQVGGSLAELVATTGSGLVTAILVNKFLLHRFHDRRLRTNLQKATVSARLCIPNQ